MKLFAVSFLALWSYKKKGYKVLEWAHPLPYQSVASAHFPPTLHTSFYSSIHALPLWLQIISKFSSKCQVFRSINYYFKNFEALDFYLICLSTLLCYSCMAVKCSLITKGNWLCFLITYYLHLWGGLSFRKGFTHVREQLITARFPDLTEKRDDGRPATAVYTWQQGLWSTTASAKQQGKVNSQKHFKIPMDKIWKWQLIEIVWEYFPEN